MNSRHPLHLFKFCPRCGSPCFLENDARSKRCADCGFTYYHNAAAATVAVIFNEKGELLTVRRALEPARGTLDLPGGFVDPGESITEGCLREVTEETGGQARIESFLFSLPNTYRYSGFDVSTADAFFLCRFIDNTELGAHDDAASLQWLPLSEVHPEDFGLLSVREGVRRILEMFKKNNPIFYSDKSS